MRPLARRTSRGVTSSEQTARALDGAAAVQQLMVANPIVRG